MLFRSVHGALLIEPTETESKATLDRFIGVLKALSAEAKDGKVEKFRAAPTLTPRRRLDETGAARQPVLRWTPPKEPVRDAAEETDRRPVSKTARSLSRERAVFYGARLALWG